MSGIITGMSDQALLDQGSQGSKKNMWKTTLAKTVTPEKRWEKEEDKAGNILFYYPEFFDLPLDSVRVRVFMSKFSPYSANSTTSISSSNLSLDYLS